MNENVVPLSKPFRRPDPPAPRAPASTIAAPVLVPFPRWQKACERVAAALLGGETRVVVTGPPGTGKTLLLDHIARVLRAAGWTVVIRLADAAPPPAQPGRVVVLVDEADRLSREALQRLLTITPGPLVLAGLEALQPRVPDAIQISLGPLPREEARDYIASWLAFTGRTPENLQAAAMRRTVELSGGVPRLLSTLLSAASWLAESSDETVVTVAHIEEAAALRSCFAPAESEPGPAADRAPAIGAPVPVALALAALMVLLGTATFVVTHFYPLQMQRAFHTLQRTVGRAQPGGRNTTAGKTVPPQPLAQAAAPPPVQLAPPPEPKPPRTAHPAPRTVETPDSPPPRAASIDVARPNPAEPAPPPQAKTPAAPKTIASAAPLEPPRAVLPAALISLLVQRGNDMMAIGDVTAARLLFGRAAEAGDAEAMLDMGKSYDPAILADASPLLKPDPAQSRHWYRLAVTAGNQEAAQRLGQLPAHERP